MGGSEVTFHQWGIAAGAVLNHHPFGFFADRGDAVIGLVEIIRVKEPGQPVDARDCPPVGRRSLLPCWARLTFSVGFI